ncbi:MAG: YqgE/AlgH family protein [Paramuribaculum sp.]|nr:YqgE/AlgH family protein [Paramuribaculum sp.]
MTNINKLLFNIDIPGEKPAAGKLLLAEPFLRDQYFTHSVICLIEYEEHGTAMGIVMNHSTNYTLQELLKEIKIEEPIRVYCGGPMSCDRLYYLHTLGDLIPGSREVAPGLYIGGNFEKMTEYVNSGYPIDECIRFFIGYSGWSPAQLDDEIKGNTWVVISPPAASELLKEDDDSYWHTAVRRAGDNLRGWLYHPVNIHSN